MQSVGTSVLSTADSAGATPAHVAASPHAASAVGPSLGFTAFATRTAPLMQGAAWRRWAGHLVASAYDLTHDREYASIRSAAALFDVSPLYKYRVTGKDAAVLLDHVVTRDVRRAPPGSVLYTPWCDANGHVLEDGTVHRFSEDRFRFTTAEPNLRWLRHNAVGLNVQIEDESAATAALALQGPASLDILSDLADADLRGLRYFKVTTARIRNIPVAISRTGYTGDLGYEIWVDREQAVPLWDAFIEAGTPRGMVPAGIWALDIARIEAGLLMIDVDYISSRHALIPGQKSSPYELNLGWAVKLDKPHFVGQRALREAQRRAPAWKFVGIEVDWSSFEKLHTEVGLPPHVPAIAWRTSVPLYAAGRQVGYATSGCWSPVLKKLIALAHVEAAHGATDAPLEIEVTIEHRRKRAAAHVRPIPFFDPARKRAVAGAGAALPGKSFGPSGSSAGTPPAGAAKADRESPSR